MIDRKKLEEAFDKTKIEIAFQAQHLPKFILNSTEAIEAIDKLYKEALAEELLK